MLGAASAKADGKQLDPSVCAPSQNTFTLTINNPYFPLPVGGRWVLGGIEEGETIGLQITVLNQTQAFFGGTVTTRVIEERQWADTNGNGRIDRGEDLIEVSLNYFAQTQDGTVCYFGESVDIYENGVIVSHQGSWRADAAGNAPGVFMPASPTSGIAFAQEGAPGVAEDQAKIVGTGTVTVPAGTFPDAIRVREFNPLDGGKEYKAYAPGVGLIVDDTLSLLRYG
jgi:hypothetical protein